MGRSSQAGKMGESTTFSRLLNVICFTLAIYDVLFLKEGKWKFLFYPLSFILLFEIHKIVWKVK